MDANLEWGGVVPADRLLLVPHHLRGLRAAPLVSGRASIYAAAMTHGARAVWLPAYLCPTVRDFLLRRGFEVREYHIGEDWLPCIDTVAPDELVMWTHWLGCMPGVAVEAVHERFSGRLVLDNCHAFFAEPMVGAYNVYSCRKFLGVPEGGFLVSAALNEDALPEEESDGAGFDYLKRARTGSNAVYAEYLDHEKSFEDRYERMSPVVQAVIAGTDLGAVRAARRENLDILLGMLGDMLLPGVQMENRDPIWFPLYVEDDGLRKRLIERNVFVPRLWRRVLDMPAATQAEMRLAKYLLPLPIDQRYTTRDIEALAGVVRAAVRG